ncbi:hypothetical protein F0562_024812 [Nyssa sinensis]|uniref:Large ribosomal subunit protein uL29m n=1 Tax=Nyssa sinensis TaxID=561372 RepID=A0A5J5BDS6_9ASTE|nr:hypothetical protein F0562_024812 [Nyssa sinensis]
MIPLLLSGLPSRTASLFSPHSFTPHFVDALRRRGCRPTSLHAVSVSVSISRDSRHHRIISYLSNLFTIMFLTRVLGRTLFAAAKSETSAAAAAAASTTRTGHNPLEEFFEADRSPDEEKPVVYGRSWKASELRLKSWDDLNKLWYVLLKEKNMLMTQRQMLHAQNLRFPNPERIPKVRKSMCRIKHVLTERAIEDPDPRRSSEMKRMINAL